MLPDLKDRSSTDWHLSPDYKSFDSQEMGALKRNTKCSLQVHRKKGNVVNTNLPQVTDCDPLRRASCVTSPGDTEKSVMDWDTPELVAFYQQYNYEFVKDIFMDTEVPSLKQCCLVENCELDHKNISCILNSYVESDSESTSKNTETLSNDSCKDVIRRCGSGNLVMEHEADSDAIGDILTAFSIDNEVPEKQLIGEVPGRKADLASYMVLESTSAEAIDDNSYTSEASSKRQMESENPIYLSDSSIATINSKEKFQQNADFQQLLETETFSKPGDSMLGSLISSTQSIVHQNDQGETDSFAAGSLCISLRSNSSTASSGSFAFPVLASDWDGSPVRMAKPDRRQSINHRNRRMCFLCCQF